MRSVIEASQMKCLKRVAFVSKNSNDFDANTLRSQAQAQDVILLFYKSLDELQHALSPFLEKVFKGLQERHSELAKQAVGLVIGQLEEFLRGQFIHTEDTSLEILKIED